MNRTFWAVAVLAAAAGCAPAINPQMKMNTDRMIQEYSKGSHNEPEPSGYQVMDWAPGQWVAFRTTTGKPGEEQVSFTKMSVVEQTADGIWIETVQQSYQGKSITKVLYDHAPRTAEEAADVVKKIVTQKDNEAPQVMDFTQPNPMGDMMKGMMKQTLTSMSAPDISAEGKTSVTTPAGTFNGAGQYTTTVSVPGKSMTVRSWFHPAVPLNGTVKGESGEDNYKMELLDYGTTGAVSELPTP